MYGIIPLLMLACVLAAIGLVSLWRAARAKNADAIQKATYWFLGAVAAVVAGLGLLFAA